MNKDTNAIRAITIYSVKSTRKNAKCVMKTWKVVENPKNTESKLKKLFTVDDVLDMKEYVSKMPYRLGYISVDVGATRYATHPVRYSKECLIKDIIHSIFLLNGEPVFCTSVINGERMVKFADEYVNHDNLYKNLYNH